MIHKSHWELAHAPNPVGLHPETRAVTFEISDHMVDELLRGWSAPVQLRLQFNRVSDTYDLICKRYPE